MDSVSAETVRILAQFGRHVVVLGLRSVARRIGLGLAGFLGRHDMALDRRPTGVGLGQWRVRVPWVALATWCPQGTPWVPLGLQGAPRDR